MILAAGLGVRMRPLTMTCPKPLLKAGGKPLIVWHIERLAKAGFHDLVINTSWLGEQMESTLGDGGQWGVDIHYSREGEPLETAGGLRHAQRLLGSDPFLVVNGDIWCEVNFASLPSVPAGYAHLVLVDNPVEHLQGDFHLVEDGSVLAVGEPRLTFSGVGVYRPELLALLPDENKLAPLLRAAMAEGLVTGEYFSGRWWDIGTPERLSQLNALLRNTKDSGRDSTGRR
jgi:MurNAc alpha-1-phosphate uridylyltransferase